MRLQRNVKMGNAVVENILRKKIITSQNLHLQTVSAGKVNAEVNSYIHSSCCYSSKEE